MKVLPEAFLSFFFPTHITNVAREEKKRHENKTKPAGIFVFHTCSYLFPNRTSVLSIDFMSLLANLCAQVVPLSLLLKPTFHRLVFSPAFIILLLSPL